MARNNMRMTIGWACGLVAAALVAGCERTAIDSEGAVSLAQLQGNTATVDASTQTGTGTGTGTSTGTSTGTGAGGDAGTSSSTNSLWPAEITGTVKFLHANVSDWAVTASLSASVSGSSINMPYSKSKVWPAVDGVNANPWVFANIGGQWYAGTFEWFRYGQTSKPKGVLDGSMGDHIKVSPMSGWRPSSGERIGLMVSGLARTSMRNVQERSNVVMVTWP